jgi:hypothetical protein
LLHENRRWVIVLLTVSNGRRHPRHLGNGDLELEIPNGVSIPEDSAVTNQKELDAIVEPQGQHQGQGKEKEKEKEKTR